MKITTTAVLATCLALVFSLSAWAQSTRYTGALLWKVTGKDITKPSYILGTHHLTDISFLDRIEGFTKSFESCNTIVGELDLRNKTELTQTVQQSVVISKNEKGYRELLSEEDFNKLNSDLIKHLGMPLEPFINVKPTLLSTLLAAKMYSSVNPNYNPQSHTAIDEYVQVLAKQQGKTVKGLETAEDQIKALFSDPIEEQLEELICTLNEAQSALESIKQMEQLYENKDLNGLYKLAFDDDNSSVCPMRGEKKHTILDNRNEQWLKKLPQLLKDDSNFIAVGALHLAGKEGLLYQLAEMGYTIEAVK